MTIELAEEPMTALPEYARIPIVFTVDRVFDVTSRADASGGFELSERRLDAPYQKDYDAVAGEGPLQWPRRFNLSNWAIFIARLSGTAVGGAAVAFDMPGPATLKERRDVAVLWDIRVSQDARRRGVGAALFGAVEARAQRRGCRELEIESQNNNVGACRFYQRRGCQLRAMHRAVYAAFPEELQLLWYKDLPR